MLQNSQDINWWLEVLKIISPIFSALVLGVWLNSRNEKIKAELQKQFYESQVKTEERKLYLQKLEELIDKISETSRNSYYYVVKTIDYAQLPYSVEKVSNLYPLVMNDVVRAETLLNLYTYGLLTDYNDFSDLLGELAFLSHEILKTSNGEGASNEQIIALEELYKRINKTCDSLLIKILKQANQYKHLKFSNDERVS